jgi:NitT/TauT family transport system substrate-binding protein
MSTSKGQRVPAQRNGNFVQKHMRIATALAAAIVLALAVVPIAGTDLASAQSDEVIHLGASPFESHGVVYYAQEEGFFRRAGLSVDVQVYSGGSAIMAAVVGGALQAGLGNPIPLANARERGVRLLYIAPGYIRAVKNPADTLLVVATGSPIRAARDLNGKTIAIVGVKGMDTIAVDAWADAHGGDSASLKYLELPQNVMADAVTSGRVDAAVIAEPALGEALRAGRVHTFAKPYDALGDIMIAGVFSTEDWALKHADTIRRFQEAINQAAAWAVKNPQQAAVDLQKYTKASISRVHEYHATTLDPALIQPILDASFRYKLIDRPLDARDLIWRAN